MSRWLLDRTFLCCAIALLFVLVGFARLEAIDDHDTVGWLSVGAGAGLLLARVGAGLDDRGW